ncbi:MAG: hypothetical protein GY832_18745 [Chloroflexi bacterium]|nr:hypothetical protein [Chloroflexota bacterium]
MSIVERVAALEKRVTRLEQRDRRILALLDYDRSPQDHFALEYKLSDEQVRGQEDALEDAHKTLIEDGTVDATDFEDSILPFVPSQFARPRLGQFIQNLLIMVRETHRWDKLCDHFQDTYNLPKQGGNDE